MKRNQMIIVVSVLFSLFLVSCQKDLETSVPTNTEQVEVSIHEENGIIKVTRPQNEEDKIAIQESMYEESELVQALQPLHEEKIIEPYSERWLLTKNYLIDLYELILEDSDMLIESLVLIIDNEAKESYIVIIVINDYDINLNAYKDSLYLRMGKKFPLKFEKSTFPYFALPEMSIDRLVIKDIDHEENIVITTKEEEMGGFLYRLSALKLMVHEDTVFYNSDEEKLNFSELRQGMFIEVSNDGFKVDIDTKALLVNKITVQE